MPAKITKKGRHKYLLTVSAGYDGDGKQILFHKTIETDSKTEAKIQYGIFAASVRAGTATCNPNLTLREFADLWMRQYCKPHLAPKTVESYQNQLENRILPSLGSLKLRKITPVDIIDFTNRLRSEGKRYDKKGVPLSDKVILYCFRVLSSMLHDAVEWQVLDSNPCDNVPRPKVKRKTMEMPQEGVISGILYALRDEPEQYRLLILLAITTGMRRGELVGLKWEDVDLNSGRIFVRRTAQVVNKVVITKPPKTEGSVRSLFVTGTVLTMLRNHYQEQKAQQELLSEIWVDEGWVFAQWNGVVIYPDTPTHWWLKFLKRHNLPHLPFHGLRHLNATILVGQGVPLKNVSARLGHADISTTANIYADVLASVDMDAAKKMDAFLKTKNPPGDDKRGE